MSVWSLVMKSLAVAPLWVLAEMGLALGDDDAVLPSLQQAAALAQACGVPEVPESAVVSVILGDPDVAVAAAAACLDGGIRVGCFRPPTVPIGTSRLRLTARASLTDDEVELARVVLTEVLAAGNR